MLLTGRSLLLQNYVVKYIVLDVKAKSVEKKVHSFRIRKELIRALKMLSAYEGTSVSELVENAIYFYLSSHYADLLKKLDEAPEFLEKDANGNDE